MDRRSRTWKETGASERTIFSVFLDVMARKEAEEANELFACGMSHRLKNLMAIAAGLTAITSCWCDTTGNMALQLTVRLTALGRAHDLVRPVQGQEEERTSGRGWRRFYVFQFKGRSLTNR